MLGNNSCALHGSCELFLLVYVKSSQFDAWYCPVAILVVVFSKFMNIVSVHPALNGNLLYMVKQMHEAVDESPGDICISFRDACSNFMHAVKLNDFSNINAVPR